MNGQTLADVFDRDALKGSARQLFSLADIEKTAELAAAETVDNARSLVDTLAARAAGRILDISVMEIMAGAWCKMAALQEYAAGEKLNSNKTHKFVLSQLEITSKHAPTIELYVYDRKVTDVTVNITLTLLVAKTVLRIKHGRIVEVRISGCQAKGKLSSYGQEILSAESTELKFPSAIKLKEGIEIPPPLKLKVA